MRPATVLMAFSMLTFSITPAYAYLDPGTGSMILQALIGGIAAGIAVISLYYRRVKAYFNKWLGRDKTTQVEGNDGPR